MLEAIYNIAPSSFFSYDSPIRVLDDKKNAFYFHPNKERNITFNLPEGLYYTENNLQKLNSFKPYKKTSQKTDFIVPEGIKIEIGENPNKATIWPKKLHILCDPSIANHIYKPVTRFVLGHELGHNGFMEEEPCDIYSANLMLDAGYNPTQIDAAKEILFKNNWHRKNCVERDFMSLNNRR